jgi:electron transport complex protein RnfB
MADKCSGCEICSRICPVNAIEGDKKEVHEVLEGRCVGCLLCIDRCPKEAIRIKVPAHSSLELASR